MDPFPSLTDTGVGSFSWLVEARPDPVVVQRPDWGQSWCCHILEKVTVAVPQFPCLYRGRGPGCPCLWLWEST